MNHSPIFIHSLFRSGSTYMFITFRRSAFGYWCYQEPLNELAFFCRENPLGFEECGEEKALLLRHPKLNGSYYKELQETWPVWKDVINEQIIYDAYFAGQNEEIGLSYWRSLAVAARGRPVFQECRTCGRIGAIKSQIGGYHIYLWRNPWDQWWSYKITPNYFDIANQLIIHARNAPEPVRLMMADLALPAYRESDIAGAFAFYRSRPLDSEHSYLIFYMLWCLGLREGLTHADLLLNIDKLSDSMDYRAEIQARLRDEDIYGIDFSDCCIPQGRYLKNDQDFFVALEERVHVWLKQGGWTEAEIEKVQSIRQQYQPASWSIPIDSISSAQMAEQAARARELARHFETNRANAETKAQQAEAQAAQAEAKAQEAEAQAAQAEAKAQEAEAQAAQAEMRAQEAEAALETTRKELHDVHQSNHHHWQLAEARRQQIEALLNSKSWRITRPLRWLYDLALHGRDTFKRAAKHLTASLLSGLIRFAASRPRLKRLALAWVKRHPRLEARLIRFAVQRDLTGPQAAQGPSVSVSPHIPHDLQDLSPRAREIYFQLKAAIEQNKKENG